MAKVAFEGDGKGEGIIVTAAMSDGFDFNKISLGQKLCGVRHPQPCDVPHHRTLIVPAADPIQVDR